MSTYGVSRTTTAPPDAVWRVWSDPATWSAWNPSVESVDLDGGFAPGSKGTMHSCDGGRRSFPIAIESVGPGQRFSLSSPGPPLTTFVFNCEVTPAPDGGSTIAQWAEMRGPLAGLLGVLMGHQMAKHFVPVLDGLAKHCEAVAPAPA